MQAMSRQTCTLAPRYRFLPMVQGCSCSASLYCCNCRHACMLMLTTSKDIIRHSDAEVIVQIIFRPTMTFSDVWLKRQEFMKTMMSCNTFCLIIQPRNAYLIIPLFKTFKQIKKLTITTKCKFNVQHKIVRKSIHIHMHTQAPTQYNQVLHKYISIERDSIYMYMHT